MAATLPCALPLRGRYAHQICCPANLSNPARLLTLISSIQEKDCHNPFLELAEREGFEPSIRDKPYTPLAGERLQPLGHLSVKNYLIYFNRLYLIETAFRQFAFSRYSGLLPSTPTGPSSLRLMFNFVPDEIVSHLSVKSIDKSDLLLNN